VTDINSQVTFPFGSVVNGTKYYWYVLADNLSLLSEPSSIWSFEIENFPATAWWQAEGGNVHANNGNVSSQIPVTCSGSCLPYLITEADNGTTGLVSYSGTVNTNGHDISQDGNNWQAKTEY
jgi:hypothetical protein